MGSRDATRRRTAEPVARGSSRLLAHRVGRDYPGRPCSTRSASSTRTTPPDYPDWKLTPVERAEMTEGGKSRPARPPSSAAGVKPPQNRRQNRPQIPPATTAERFLTPDRTVVCPAAATPAAVDVGEEQPSIPRTGGPDENIDAPKHRRILRLREMSKLTLLSISTDIADSNGRFLTPESGSSRCPSRQAAAIATTPSSRLRRPA